MRVYVDLILVLNFGFDFILIFATAMILRRQTNLKKMIFGALLGSLTTLSLFISMSSFILFLVKIVISILMVLVSFGYSDIKYVIRNLFYLYTSSIILGGFLYLLNIEFTYKNSGLVFYYNGLSVNFIVLLVVSPVIIYFYVKQGIELKNNYSNYYNIDIYLKNGKIIEATGFVDSGNKLEDPYKKRPIILLNKSLIDVDYDKDHILLVPYDSLNNHSLLKCVVPDKIFIQGVGFKKNFLIGLSDMDIGIDGVDCILNSRIMERKII